MLSEFLSTLSLRRATAVQHSQIHKHNNFYPRSPCGERPIRKRQIIPIIQFLSTLSLRRATTGPPSVVLFNGFLSTLSLRRATGSRRQTYRQGEFLSTLSLRRATPALYQLYDTYAFLSTLSLRRATFSCFWCILNLYISIHALLAESDTKF